MNFFLAATLDTFDSLLNIFGKGYLAPIDYLIILIIMIVGAFVGIVLYFVTLSAWVRKVRFPFTMRLLWTGFSLTLIGIITYWFLHFVLKEEPPPMARDLYWPTGIIFGLFLIYTIIVWSTAKKPRTR